MNRSTAAFIIAFLFHILLLLLFFILLHFIPIHQHFPPKEHKIKISLRNFHPSKPLKRIKKHNYGKKKQLKQPLTPPPMPKGSQLKKIIKQKYIQHKFKTIKIVHKKIKKIRNTVKKTQRVIIKQQKIKTINVINKQNNNNHSILYSFLKTPVSSKLYKKANRYTNQTSQVVQNIKKLYGETFGKLSAGEQKYILNNEQIMRRITQQILNRVGSVNIPNNLHVTTFNIVQFYLHPNGNMTDFKFIKKSNYYILDETTKETIQYAYSKYPLPAQTTLIRYRVNFFLQQ